MAVALGDEQCEEGWERPEPQWTCRSKPTTSNEVASSVDAEDIMAEVET